MTSIILLAAVAAAFGDSGSCQKVGGQDAVALLRRAAERTGLRRTGDAVLKLNAFDVTSHAFESDRMYSPALADVDSMEQWFDPATGAERVTEHSTLGGYESRGGSLSDAHASYATRDTTLVPSEQLHATMYEGRRSHVLYCRTNRRCARGTCERRARDTTTTVHHPLGPLKRFPRRAPPAVA